MNLGFEEANAQQEDLWLTALHNLLNLPFGLIPLDVIVEFVDPSELIGHGHTDLASTETTYDSSESTTRVRNDAPGFGSADRSLEALAAQMGLEYSAARHFHETAAHELGHSFFAALPHAQRLAIVKMFGATTDDLEVINDQDKEWQDRVVEGVAETFKEAFLPRRFRVFPNRSNRRIAYHEFPAFREHFRGGSGFSYVYGSDDFRVDLSGECNLSGRPYHRSDHDPEAFVYFEGIPGFEAGWGIDMAQFDEAGKLPFSMEEEEGGAT